MHRNHASMEKFKACRPPTNLGGTPSESALARPFNYRFGIRGERFQNK